MASTSVSGRRVIGAPGNRKNGASHRLLTDTPDGARTRLLPYALQAGFAGDLGSESVGKKIREAEVAKLPYMLLVGDKEAEDGAVAVRRHREGDIGAMPVSEFRDLALEEVSSKRARQG